MTTETETRKPGTASVNVLPSRPSALPRRVSGRRTARSSVVSILKHVGLIAVCLVMLYPVLWMLAASLRPESQIFNSTGLIPVAPTLKNYPRGWSSLDPAFGRYLLNSAVLVLGSVIGNMISCSMAAYAFARLRFMGRGLLFAAMLLTLMLPIHVIIVPQYILFSKLGWINTFLPLLVPKFLATDAFFVFLMVQFIRGIPRELDEAARIDGAGHPRIFLQVVLPLMVPALATTAIFTFIWTWSDFFSQLIYLTDPSLYTVSIALSTFIDQTSNSDWGGMFAMNIVSLIPVFLGFLFGQRLLLRGIATTGGK
jgi:multiple sugar transport system permease protein